jgi:hypothetical protein
VFANAPNGASLAPTLREGGLPFKRRLPRFEPVPEPSALRHRPPEEKLMSLGTILLIVLILMLIGAIPSWGHSRNWGYGPSGGLGLVVIIVLILLLTGRL